MKDKPSNGKFVHLAATPLILASPKTPQTLRLTKKGIVIKMDHKLRMRRHNEPGRLITFCGLDGCGKSTMIRRLKEYLERSGKTVFLTMQPTDFVRKSAIFRNFMDSPNHSAYDYRSLSLLAASDRIQHTNKVILPALAGGNIVISDRYFYSCLANLHARGYEEDEWIYEISGSVIEPDAAFFLDLDVSEAISRVRSRAEEANRYIDIGLQHRLREEYRQIAADNGCRLISSEISEEQTFKLIIKYIEKELKK